MAGMAPLMAAWLAAQQKQQAPDMRKQFGVNGSGTDDKDSYMKPGSSGGNPADYGARWSVAAIPAVSGPEKVEPEEVRNVELNEPPPQAAPKPLPQYFVPRVRRTTGQGGPPTLADQLFTRGHLGFADSMQDAMEKMWEVNRSNAANESAARGQWLDYQARMAAAQAPIEAEKVRATALAAALGAIGGGLGRPGDGYDSNIGQSITLRHGWPRGLRRK